MNTDDKLQQCFRELRNADAQRVSAFSRVVQAPVRPFTVPWLRVAAGVALLAVLIVALTGRHRVPVEPEQWTTLSTWHATTDELLTVSEMPWGSTLSTPTDTWIEDPNQTNAKETL